MRLAPVAPPVSPHPAPPPRPSPAVGEAERTEFSRLASILLLAALALLAPAPGDVVPVATDNVGHLGQFVDARPWGQIAP